jgi:hypothetical protein
LIVVVDPRGDPRADVVEAEEWILVENFVACAADLQNSQLRDSVDCK